MASIASSVRWAGVDQVAQVSATLADALANDPVFLWLLPSQRRRDTRLRRLFALELAHWVFPAGGRALTTDVFRGANVELPPGRSQMSMTLSGAIGLAHVFEIRLRRAGRLQGFVDRNHPSGAAQLHPHPGRGHALPGPGPRDGVAAAHP
jgi:hypothetical protein